MNLGTIIGLLLGLGLLGLAVFLGANEADVPILKLWHTVSLLIVFPKLSSALINIYSWAMPQWVRTCGQIYKSS